MTDHPRPILAVTYVGDVHIMGCQAKVVRDGKRVEVNPKVHEMLDRIARKVSKQRLESN